MFNHAVEVIEIVFFLVLGLIWRRDDYHHLIIKGLFLQMFLFCLFGFIIEIWGLNV